MTVERDAREGGAARRRRYDTVVGVARRADGELDGYTWCSCLEARADAQQDDTLVMPAHRGHGLGLALKASVLRVLAA